MFKRILYDNWTSIVPITAFVLTSAVFIIATLRALLTSKETIHKTALLPLDGTPADEQTPKHPNELP